MFKNYPKLSAVLLSYIIVFGLFAIIGPADVHHLVEPLGIGGIIVAGALYTYGFTASLGAVLLVAITPDYSPFLMAFLGALGATAADITIFKFLKGNLRHEVQRIARFKPVRQILASPLIKNRAARSMLGFLVVASPLPDEIGVAFLSMTKMSLSQFRLVTFAANFVGVYALTALSHIVY